MKASFLAHSAHLVILFCLVFALPGYAQFSLQGIIQNGADNSPVPFANVFLANTTLGTLSTEDGKFLLKDIPKGRLELIISCVGFETLKLSVQTTERKLYRIILKPSEENLLNVTVRAKRSSKWKENLAFFESHFIGASDNAHQCKLINPEVLAFYDTLNVFKARASDLLIIENRGLGYRLKYALLSFFFDYQAKLISFKGYPVFEPLIPQDEREAERWRINREKAFRGSLLHFMRSLYQCHLFREDFVVQRIVEKVDKSGLPRLLTVQGKRILFNPTPADTIIREVQDTTLGCRQLINPVLSTKTQVVVSFQGLLQVTYTKEKEPFSYQYSLYPTQKFYIKSPQVSLIKLVQPNVTVEADGHFYETDGLVAQGYWSWELLAEMLPLDYGLLD